MGVSTPRGLRPTPNTPAAASSSRPGQAFRGASSTPAAKPSAAPAATGAPDGGWWQRNLRRQLRPGTTASEDARMAMQMNALTNQTLMNLNGSEFGTAAFAFGHYIAMAVEGTLLTALEPFNQAAGAVESAFGIDLHPGYSYA